jgi:hypothetical protein
VLCIDLASKIMNAICYGAGIDRVIKYADFGEDSDGYTNQIPLSTDANGNDYVGTNGEDGYKVGYRLNSSGNEVAQTGMCCTGFIPYTRLANIQVKNITPIGTSTAYVNTYDASKKFKLCNTFAEIFTDDGNGVYSGSIDTSASYIRLSVGVIDTTSILTINEEIPKEPDQPTDGYTNLANPSDESWLNNTRFSTSTTGNTSTQEGMVVVNYISYKGQKILRAKGLDFKNSPYGIVPIFVRYSTKGTASNLQYIANKSTYDETTHISTVDISSWMLNGEYFRFSANLVDGYTAEDVIITLDEEITGGESEAVELVWNQGYNCGYKAGDSDALYSSSNYYTSDKIEVLGGSTYEVHLGTHSLTSTNFTARAVYYNSSNKVILAESIDITGGGTHTLTIPSECVSFRIRSYCDYYDYEYFKTLISMTRKGN